MEPPAPEVSVFRQIERIKLREVFKAPLGVHDLLLNGNIPARKIRIDKKLELVES